MASRSATKATTLGELKAAGYRTQPVKVELRRNLIAKLRASEVLFPGIVGYEETVVPQLANAILGGQDIILLGERGQAKSRIVRGLTALLDDQIPVLKEAEIPEDPFRPATAQGRAIVADAGDGAAIAWLPRTERYAEKLATPDITIADLIGEVDPIKVAEGRYLGDELTLHFGLVPRANRGIFAINELPDLAERILPDEDEEAAYKQHMADGPKMYLLEHRWCAHGARAFTDPSTPGVVAAVVCHLKKGAPEFNSFTGNVYRPTDSTLPELLVAKESRTIKSSNTVDHLPKNARFPSTHRSACSRETPKYGESSREKIPGTTAYGTRRLACAFGGAACSMQKDDNTFSGAVGMASDAPRLLGCRTNGRRSQANTSKPPRSPHSMRIFDPAQAEVESLAGSVVWCPRWSRASHPVGVRAHLSGRTCAPSGRARARFRPAQWTSPSGSIGPRPIGSQNRRAGHHFPFPRFSWALPADCFWGG